MLKNLLSIGLVFFVGQLIAQSLQSPSAFLGYEHGSYFSRHHQVVSYFEELEEWGEGTLKLEQYGVTNENRKLILAYISTPENLARIESIKKAHETGVDEDVAIVWLSYNVHGNESSGTEAAMQTAYELMTLHQDWLKDVVVIMDPCLNPDGRDRYVNWYNQKKNNNYDVDINSSEHNEAWPGGRTNHYFFDLNRDWAWLTQVESRQRMVVYNQWLPHVHVDFHEMGINSPYYFAPGAEPIHKNITEWQGEFQEGLGRNHAGYFDENGWLYYTGENFDLIYPGFGDTYPMFNGAIGMTYEKGGSGSAGLGVIDNNGDELTLKDRILEHHTTGISTVEFSAKKKDELVKEYLNFVSDKNYKYKSYVVSGQKDNLRSLIRLLDLHEIAYSFGNGSTVKGYNYSSLKKSTVKTNEKHLIISTQQKKGTLVNVLFEPTTEFSDSVTYDITAWSLPYAYGLECIASETEVIGADGEIGSSYQVNEKSYAYLIPWESVGSAKVLADLLKAGVRVRYSEESFSFGDKEYQPGTLIIIEKENIGLRAKEIIDSACKKEGLAYFTTGTGMVDEGKDFGSESVNTLGSKRVALISGEGYSSNRIGDVWSFFEQELKYPLTIIEGTDLRESALENIDVLIIPSGWGSNSNTTIVKWVENGGTAIAMGYSMNSFSEENGFQLKEVEEPENEDEKDEYKDALIAYSEQDRQYTNDQIPGSIFKCKVDNSHPLAFGYGDEYFTLRRTGKAYDLLKHGDNVFYLDEEAECISGFVGEDVAEKQKNSLIFGVDRKGSGSVVYMADNPLFRGFWENGKLLFVNAVFFVD